MSKTLYHPDAEEPVTVPDRAAKVLKKTGWTEKAPVGTKAAGQPQADKERSR